MRSVCVVEPHVTGSYVTVLSVAHSIGFMANLCRRQQCKLYVPVLREIVVQPICTISHVTYKHYNQFALFHMLHINATSSLHCFTCYV